MYQNVIIKNKQTINFNIRIFSIDFENQNDQSLTIKNNHVQSTNVEG
jgi:hypothetical protein